MKSGSLVRTQLAIQTPIDNSSNGFIATEVQTALEELKAAINSQRFSIQLINNGTLTNNQRVGFDALLAGSPVIVPRNSTLKEITYTNTATNSDARFDIYLRPAPASSATPGGTAVLLQQWTLTNALTGVLSGMSHVFSAGEEILIIFVDTGDNPSDSILSLFFLGT